jgi:hypothetical protein
MNTRRKIPAGTITLASASPAFANAIGSAGELGGNKNRRPFMATQGAEPDLRLPEDIYVRKAALTYLGRVHSTLEDLLEQLTERRGLPRYMLGNLRNAIAETSSARSIIARIADHHQQEAPSE